MDEKKMIGLRPERSFLSREVRLESEDIEAKSL